MIETADLLALAPHADRTLLSGLVPALNVALPLWRLATAPRLPHFLAQAAQETDGFRTLEEYASGDGYEGRTDLGNVLAGDGRRFKGRGIFQTTGRSNYARLGTALGLPLLDEPARLTEPGLAVLSACIYWADADLSILADAGDGIGIGRAINRGNPLSAKPANGEADRLLYLAVAQAIWPAPSTPKVGAPTVRRLQQALNDLGAAPVLLVDGDIGPLTAEALRQFQTAHGLIPDGRCGEATWTAITAALAALPT